MKLFGPGRLALQDRHSIDAALDEAFAPLRARTANIGATRIRAAVRWSQPEPRPIRGFALLARIGELSVAAVISALLVGATLPSGTGVTDGVSRDTDGTDAWMLNGRTALQRPIDSRVSDYRMTVGDLADNAVTARRAASQPDRAPEQTFSNR